MKLKKGIITGIIMVFLPAVSTFVIPQLLGGGQYMMIGNLIEKQFLLTGNWYFGSALSMILMLFILISIFANFGIIGISLGTVFFVIRGTTQ